MFAGYRVAAIIRSKGLDTVAAVSTPDVGPVSAAVDPVIVDPVAVKPAVAEHQSPDVASSIAIPSEPADLTEEMQRKVYELVKARVVQSIGAGANWTIAFRTSSDTDTFFSDTMADMIAWDVAHQLIAPTVPNRARLAS